MNSLFALCALLSVYVVAGEFQDSSFRIVNGIDIDIEYASYQALVTIEIRNEPDLELPKQKFLCGGAIISHSVILTAAHCIITAKKITDIVVQTGSAHEKNATYHYLDEFEFNEKYDERTKDNDIAVLKIQGRITNVRPIPLATVDPMPGKIGKFTGWGRFIANSTATPEVLKVARVRVMDTERCRKLRYANFVVTDKQICTEPYLGNGCKGDSGGPLVVGNKLVGLLSWGFSSCKGPLVFTSIAKYRNWINLNTGI